MLAPRVEPVSVGNPPGQQATPPKKPRLSEFLGEFLFFWGNFLQHFVLEKIVFLHAFSILFFVSGAKAPTASE